MPRLPLLLRLPISVCELDCDIPSKKGLSREAGMGQGQAQGEGQWDGTAARECWALGLPRL